MRFPDGGAMLWHACHELCRWGMPATSSAGGLCHVMVFALHSTWLMRSFCVHLCVTVETWQERQQTEPAATSGSHSA